MSAILALLGAIAFWVAIFVFFMKRANRAAERFSKEMKSEIRRLAERVDQTLSADIELLETVSSKLEDVRENLKSAGETAVSELAHVRERLEKAESAISQLLQEKRVERVVDKRLAQYLPFADFPSIFPTLSDYQGEYEH